MRTPDEQYLELLQDILDNGDERLDRTGVGTISRFGAMLRFDMSEGRIPLLTTKRVYWKTAVKEMLWFLTGQTNIQSLLQQNVRIWTDWPLDRYRRSTGEDISQEDFETRILSNDAFAREWGDLGPVYGKQWRRWLGADGVEYDQIASVVKTLQTNPFSRRILFHGWKVDELDGMALPPCHLLYQFGVSGPKRGSGSDRNRLNLILFQRSVDSLLGAPFNFMGGAALMHMIAQQADLDLGDFVWVGADTHIYLNHIDQVREQMTREPRDQPRMALLRRPHSIDGYRIDDFSVTGYDPHPAIEASVAV